MMSNCFVGWAACAQVRVAASKATVAFIMEALSGKHKKRFADVIPALLQSLVVMLQSNEEDTARAILEEMIELADTTAFMFRGYTSAVVDIGNSIIENVNADDSTSSPQPGGSCFFI